ncbi:serine carboxypeptidase-like protein [Tanacetum coccineum]
MVEFVSVCLVVAITTTLLAVRVLYVVYQTRKPIREASQKHQSTLVVLGSVLTNGGDPAVPDSAHFMQIYRSREVGQSYITSVGTTLLAIGHALWLMVKIRPQVILCNGPGTCIPICAIAFVFKYYDIRKECVTSICYDFSDMETLLNKKSVRQALGVGDIEFVSCSTTVYTGMLVDWMRNLEAGFPNSLKMGLRCLCTLENMMSSASGLSEAPFEVVGSEAGLRKSYGPLSFLKADLKMLKRWMDGTLSETPRGPKSLVSSI